MKRIRLNAENARVLSLKRKRAKRRFGIPEVVSRRAKRKYKNPPAFSMGLGIAQLLYPHAFPKQIANSIDAQTTFTKRIYLDRQSQEGIRQYYNAINSGNTPNEQNAPKYASHCKRIQEQANELRTRIFQESGIFVNTKPMNVGVSKNGKLVFFEVNSIFLPNLKKKIAKMPESEKKQVALEILEFLKTKSNNEGVVTTHPESFIS